jgi:hypothetical protein
MSHFAVHGHSRQLPRHPTQRGMGGNQEKLKHCLLNLSQSTIFMFNIWQLVEARSTPQSLFGAVW